MASQPWSSDDLQLLEQHVHNEDWLEEVAERFPDRSVNSLSVCMSRLRSRLGIPTKRGARVKDDQDAANAKAVVATHRLLERTLQVGRWS